MSKGGTAYNVSFVNNSSNADDNSITTEAAIAKCVRKNNNIVKKLFSTEEATRDPRILDTACEASEWVGTKNEKFHEEFVDGVSNTASLATNDKLSKASHSSRHRSSESFCKNVPMTCITEPKLMPSPMRTRRLTRSAIREAEADKINKEKPSTVKGKDLLEEEKIDVPICGSETASTFVKKMKDQVSDRGMCYDRDFEKRTCFVWVQASNYSRRLTRSAAQRQTENHDMKHYKGFEESRLSEILRGNMTLESKALEREDSSPLPLYDGICPSLGAERRKKVQNSAPAQKIAWKTEGDAPTNHACGKGVKRKTITHTKQHLRKSPRLLGFLPRTRSQVKS